MKAVGHIIVIFICVVCLLSLILIINVRSREEKLKANKDFLQVFAENRARILKNNDISISVETYFALIFISFILFEAAGFMLSDNGIISVFTGLAGAFIPDLIVMIIVNRRKKRFTENYAKALEQLASALKAGLSIQLAVKDVADSPFLDDYLKKQFAHISSDLQMGRTVQEAFILFAETVNNPYADDVALSIDIQNETGGHEAEVIQTIADGIRERIQLEREIKSIFNETVLTIRVIQTIAPLSMLGMLLILKSYRDMYLSGGIFTVMLAVLIGMEIAGVLVDNLMIRSARNR